MQTFCRVLDAQQGIDPVTSGIKSEAYTKIMEKEMAPRKQIKFDAQKKQPKITEINGFVSYQSETMLFNTLSVQGTLMKRNETPSIINPYVQRYYEINFFNGQMLIKKKIGDSSAKTVDLLMLRSCKELESEEEKRLQRHSTVVKQEQTCRWLFGFMIETHERTYQLHSPTRQDRDHWLKIFKILVKMASAGISTKK